jgi:acyl-coenzyme A synthetase/AMP-(fatty) acid ligase
MHVEVAEAAVVGLPDDLKGHVPVGICVLKSGKIVTRFSGLVFNRSLQ